VEEDQTFASILARWRSKFADFQRALGTEVVVPSPGAREPSLLDGDPEAYVRKIKQELGIDSGLPGIYDVHEGSLPEADAAEEVLWAGPVAMGTGDAQKEVAGEKADVEQDLPGAAAAAEIYVQAAEAMPEVEPSRPSSTPAEPSASQPPEQSPDQVLTRLLALEAEVVRLRGGPSTLRPDSPEADSPRRPEESEDRGEVRNSLALSLLSSSSVFAASDLCSSPPRQSALSMLQAQQREADGRLEDMGLPGRPSLLGAAMGNSDPIAKAAQVEAVEPLPREHVVQQVASPPAVADSAVQVGMTKTAAASVQTEQEQLEALAEVVAEVELPVADVVPAAAATSSTPAPPRDVGKGLKEAEEKEASGEEEGPRPPELQTQEAKSQTSMDAPSLPPEVGSGPLPARAASRDSEVPPQMPPRASLAPRGRSEPLVLPSPGSWPGVARTPGPCMYPCVQAPLPPRLPNMAEGGPPRWDAPSSPEAGSWRPCMPGVRQSPPPSHAQAFAAPPAIPGWQPGLRVAAPPSAASTTQDDLLLARAYEVYRQQQIDLMSG